jgi:hypothetical protein
MKSAEFEEREYEAPLYNQLERGSDLVWAPGQVFEGHIGIDHGIFSADQWLFRLHGYPSHLPGAVLARYRWPRHWLHRRPDRLPTFRLNLFIQAKRSTWSRRPTKILRAHGLSGMYWRFEINPHQQLALELVAARLKQRALVVYAAPAFHEHRVLYRHVIGGTLVQNSTFPSARSLINHAAWNYAEPGAKGVANAEPTAVNEPPLEFRIRNLVELASGAANQGSDRQSWRQELKSLARNIRDALSDKPLPETSRLAAFADRVHEIERETEGFVESEILAAYLTVVVFCESYGLLWHVIGPAEPPAE